MDQDIPFERIGGYRILRRLATGGTSDVLLARAEGPHGFERTVVLKLLLQQFRRDAPMEKMFAREAAAYARLSHPAIVKLYDFFSAEGQLVMVLEYIDGLPLNRFRAMLRKNGEQVDDRASIFIASRVFAALAAAHGARDPESGEFAPVIHRDVNPSNILIPWDGHVKLADFGIAKVAGVTSDTQAGFIKGTYGYMAPEQVRGEPVTVRTDVYAASLLLWELLARRKAIQRGALPEIEVLRAMAEPTLPSLDVLRPDLPQRLREAIARGLEPAPDSRSVTAEEMLLVLRESVTSNEGRNVLAETLARVRQEAEASRSGPPPAAAPESSSKVVSRPTPRPPPRVQSEASIDGRARTALGVGQVQAVGAGSPREASSTTRGDGAARPGASALRPVATMAFGAPPRTPARSSEIPAAHGSAPTRPAGTERPMTLGFAGHASAPLPSAGSSPPSAAGGGSPRMDSPPQVLEGGLPAIMAALAPGVGASSGADPLSLGPPPPTASSPPPRPMFPHGSAAEDAPATAPMPILFVGRPSPPPAPAIPPPNLFAPTPPPQSSGMPPADPLASTLAAGQAPPRTPPPPARSAPPPAPPLSPPLLLAPSPATSGMGVSKGGKYVLLACLALTASGAVVAALLVMQKAPASSPTKTALVTTAVPPPVALPAPIPTPTAVETVTAAAARTPTATPAPTPNPAPAAPLPSPTPSSTATASSTASTEGDIVTPAKMGGHRVFVDGHYAGDSPGPIHVRCGAHTVKVGSGGVSHSVSVPCGGQLSVGQR